MSYTVYMHKTPNNKVYVGITSVPISRRWQNGWGYRGQLFYRAILKYGWDNIEHIVVDTNLTKEVAEQKEIELIAEYQSNNKDYGYNVDNGGFTVGKISEETKEKLRVSMLGKQKSKETKEKHKMAQLKLWNSSEYRNARMKKYAESKRKKGYSYYKRGKPVVCIETQEVFQRIKDASEHYGICDETIRKCCHNRRRSAGGLHWRFAEEVSND